MHTIYFQDRHPDVEGSFDFTVYYQGTPYLLHGMPDVHLEDLQRFMWNMCCVYEDEQSYTIIDDDTCPPLLPGIALSVFPTLYLTIKATCTSTAIPLRYQRWLYRHERPDYRDTLALGHLADEHVSYLSTWFALNPHRSVDIHLSHPRIQEILYLLIIHMETIPRLCRITLWEAPNTVAPIEILQLLHQRVTRLTKPDTLPICVSIQRPLRRMSLSLYLGKTSPRSVSPSSCTLVPSPDKPYVSIVPKRNALSEETRPFKRTRINVSA